MSERTIIVTGASRGIGQAICRKLLDQGCRVIGIARSFGSSSLADDRFVAIPLDLANGDELPNHLRELRNRFPQTDGVICNAGRGRFGSLEEFSEPQIREMIEINLTSQILLAREFLPLLKRSGSGDLLFMGSEAALQGGKKGAVYCATKFALRGLAQSLREECAGSGVRVGLINPGMVKTGFFDDLDFEPGEATDNHLLPEDVADAVWLMLSARSGAAIDEINLSPQKKVIRFKG
jgi:NADP-dependent 3-hydroxy acid dehydrogenase YdfG